MVKHKSYKKNSSIKYRITLSFIILIFIPFIIFSGIIFWLFQEYVIQQQSETAYETLNVVGTQITDSMKNMEQKSMEFYYGDYLEWMESGHILTNVQKQQIQSKLDSIAQTNVLINAVVLRFPDGSIMDGGAFYSCLDTEKYAEIIDDGEGSCFWFGPGDMGRSNKKTYVLARSLNSKNQKNVAQIYYIFYENIVTDFIHQLNKDYRYNFIANEDGVVYYTSDDSIRQDGTESIDMSVVNKKVKTSSQVIQLNGKKYIFVTKKLMRFNWYCISMICLDDLIRNVRMITMPFLVIVFLYILFLVLMIWLLQKYIFSPLKELKKNMDMYAVNNLKPVIMQETGTGEFQSLSRHFNNMVGRTDDLLNQYKKEMEEKTQLQISMMASQLTPHFIYNALNTLKWMAVLSHQDKIRMVTESLIYIFMSATKTEDEQYTLGDELELVKNYAVIQKVRFMNFDLKMNIEPGTEKYHIRKLLLQPIVENSIVHGLGRGKIKGTDIWITVYADKYLHIEVKDFGVGFDVNKWRDRDNPAQDHTNIGIGHIENLIRMEFGEPYHLEIESQPGEGTTVRYFLPIIPVED